VLREQAAGERGRIVERARDPDRALGQRPGPRTVLGHRVLELTGERRGDPRLGRRARPVERPARGLEDDDEVAARHREPRVQAVEPQRDGAEQLRVLRGGGARPRGVQQRPGPRRVPGPEAQVGLRGEQPDQRDVRQPLPRRRHRGPGPLEVPGGLHEGEPAGVRAGRGVRPGQRGRGAGGRHRGGEVVRRLRGQHRAAALVPVPQGGRDPVVDLQPPRGREVGVDRLPVEVVDEAGGAVLAGGREDAGGRRLGRQGRDSRRVVPGHLGQDVRPGGRARDRRRLQQREARR
jgi:hypothetical protein